MSEIQVSSDDYSNLHEEVIRLRITGKGIANIASCVGVSVTKVKAILDEEFVSRYKNRQSMIDKAAMQLDFILAPLIKKYEKDALVGKPDRREAETMIKIIESQRRLFGLDSPTKVDMVHYDAMDEEALNEELRRFGVKTIPKALPPAILSSEPVSDADFTVKDDNTIKESVSDR